MPDVVVLGAGLVGGVMAADVARDPGVGLLVVDASESRLSRTADRVRSLTGRVPHTLHADLRNPVEIARSVKDAGVVLGALPSGMGWRTLQAIIESGRHYVDISFMPENPLALDGAARERGVTAVVDCGVAPGLSNLLAGWATKRLARVDELEILVGGLPRVRRWPFQYKAAFSPADVIEEYTRPARLVEHGRVVTRPALSEPESVDFEGVGTLEAFNTDGLRTLIDTLRVPMMREKTLRYPGHIELMRVLRESGFFGKDTIELKGAQVRPLDVTSALLFPLWAYEDDEPDMTVMRIRATGIQSDGANVRMQWDLQDSFDPVRRQTSMARTTAFPATIIARMVLDGRIKDRGVLPPERLAREEIVTAVLTELEERGVVVEASWVAMDGEPQV